MTLPAEFCLDMSDIFYKNAGVSKVNTNGFELVKLEDFDILFVKTDFIYNGEFQRRFLDSINKKFILISGVSSYSVDEVHRSYKDILNNHYLINKTNNIRLPIGQTSPQILPAPCHEIGASFHRFCDTVIYSNNPSHSWGRNPTPSWIDI